MFFFFYFYCFNALRKDFSIIFSFVLGEPVEVFSSERVELYVTGEREKFLLCDTFPTLCDVCKLMH